MPSAVPSRCLRTSTLWLILHTSSPYLKEHQSWADLSDEPQSGISEPSFEDEFIPGGQVLKRAVRDVFSPSYPAEPSLFLLLVARCIFTRDVYPSNDGWAVILVVHLSQCLPAGLPGRKEVVVGDH